MICPCDLGLSRLTVDRALDVADASRPRRHLLYAFDSGGLLAILRIGWVRHPVDGVMVRDGMVIDPASVAEVLASERRHGATRHPSAFAVATWSPAYNGASVVQVRAWHVGGAIRTGTATAPTHDRWGVHPTPGVHVAEALLAGGEGVTLDA